jgi:hypothetical protein
MTNHRHNEFVRQEYGIIDINRIARKDIRADCLNTEKDRLKWHLRACSSTSHRKEESDRSIIDELMKLFGGNKNYRAKRRMLMAVVMPSSGI